MQVSGYLGFYNFWVLEEIYATPPGLASLPLEVAGDWRAMGCGPARASAYFASDSRYSNSNPNRWTIGRVRWPCPAGSSPVRVSSSPELMFHSRRARRAIRIRRVGRSAVCVRVTQVRVRSADRAENREPIELRSDRDWRAMPKLHLFPAVPGRASGLGCGARCRNSTPRSSSKAMARRIAAKQIGDTGQFTNSWLKMNTAPPEFGEAVSPCLALPHLAAPRPLALPCRALSL